METSREHKGDGADPLHDGVRLRGDLRRGGKGWGITDEQRGVSLEMSNIARDDAR